MKLNGNHLIILKKSLKDTVDWYLTNDDWIRHALRNIKL